jgi:iron(II)-dependent oxidoreductase
MAPTHTTNIIPLTILLLSLLSACGPSATPAPPTVTPAPTLAPVSRNADWTPLVQDFDGVAMAQVPPGCFMMGNEDGRRDEKPVSEICFNRPYWIDQYEVTNAQYGSTGNGTRPQQPRENLLWEEARDYCVARGARLPTEAEWEYAGRGPNNLIYTWGNDLVVDNLVFDQNSAGQTADVGSRPAGVSWVGAYDLVGNVWEWVSSQYKRYPYTADDGREDPADRTQARVYRGGIHNYIDYGAGLTARFRATTDTRDWFIGFRCARDG